MRTAFSTNMIILQGNVTKDPEVKATKNGTIVMKFGLATNYSKKTEDGYEEVTTYHNIIAFGKGAEWLDGRIKKGHKIMIVGRQENRPYETEDGQKRYVSEVIADQITPFLQTNGKSSDKEVEPTSENTQTLEDISDDVPF